MTLPKPSFIERNAKSAGLSLIALGVIWLGFVLWEVRGDLKAAGVWSIEQIQRKAN